MPAPGSCPGSRASRSTCRPPTSATTPASRAAWAGARSTWARGTTPTPGSSPTGWSPPSRRGTCRSTRRAGRWRRRWLPGNAVAAKPSELTSTSTLPARPPRHRGRPARRRAQRGHRDRPRGRHAGGPPHRAADRLHRLGRHRSPPGHRRADRSSPHSSSWAASRRWQVLADGDLERAVAAAVWAVAVNAGQVLGHHPPARRGDRARRGGGSRGRHRRPPRTGRGLRPMITEAQYDKVLDHRGGGLRRPDPATGGAPTRRGRQPQASTCA